MSHQTWLVVGGNRGIGLGLVKEIISSSEQDHVIATSRNPSSSKELQTFAKEQNGRVIIVKADFNEEAGLPAVVDEIKKHTDTLEHVIINAGIAESRQPVETLSASDFTHHFSVNVASAHTAIKALYPFVEASTSPKRDISFMSTAVSSIGALKPSASRVAKLFDADFHPLGAYATSKSALNMLARVWALKLEPEGIAIALVHPGTVKTDAIDVPGAISTAESAHGLITVIKEVDHEKTASGILAYNGSVIPW